MTIGSTLTYGRFTLDEWERRAGNPYIEESGHTYRITEAVPNQAKEVRYQAVECDPSEVAEWKATQAAPKPQPVPEPEPEKTWEVPQYVQKYYAKHEAEASAQEVAPDDEEWEDVPLDVAEKAPMTETPSLSAYARTHGWAGTGRIAQRIKDAYKVEYGAEG